MILKDTEYTFRAGFGTTRTGKTVTVSILDADGTARYKKLGGIGATQVDMGAYEYGDVFFTHKNQASGSNVTILNNSNLDGDSGLDDLHVTSNLKELNVEELKSTLNEKNHSGIEIQKIEANIEDCFMDLMMAK